MSRQDESRLKNEIEHGKYLARNNAGEIWNWETPAGKIRWKRRVKMLTQDLTSGIKVLEVGCGTGYFTKEIAQLNVDLTAIDISPELIKIARKKVAAEIVKFLVEDVSTMSFEDNSFDAVVGSSILHHLDIDTALPEINRVLKDGGFIAFTEPNMLNPQISIQKNIPFIKKALGDSPDETAFFSWSVRKRLENSGFDNIEIIPFDFLHPKTPSNMISLMLKIMNAAEKIPLLKYLSGSLFIKAYKKNK